MDREMTWEDRNIVDHGPNQISGQALPTSRGVIYMPNSEVNFTGGSGTLAKCTNIMADARKFAAPQPFCRRLLRVG